MDEELRDRIKAAIARQLAGPVPEGDDPELLRSKEDLKSAKQRADVMSAITSLIKAPVGGAAEFPEPSYLTDARKAVADRVAARKALETSQLPAVAQGLDLLNSADRSDADRQRLDLERAKLRALTEAKTAAQASRGPDLTPGQKAEDISFGRQMVDYDKNGGSATVRQSIQALNSLADELENRTDLSGTLGQKAIELAPTSELSDKLRKVLTPEAAGVKQKIQALVLPGMKAMFPGAISNKESELFTNLSYSDTLSGKENAAKLRDQVKKLEAQADLMDQKAAAWKTSGTLSGLRGASAVSAPAAEGPSPEGSDSSIDDEIKALEAELGL